jgi:sugar porter (SP) family MFS transporter
MEGNPSLFVEQGPGSAGTRMNSTLVLLLSTVVAALGGLLFGFDTAVISGTTRSLSEFFTLSPATLGVTVSSALWGTVAGALLAGCVGERFGRRDSLRVMAVLYLLSAVGCAVAHNWTFFLGARILGGLGIGGSSVLGPMYIAEISPARLRGRLVAFFQFNVVVGILVAYLSNYLVSLLHLGGTEWRWQLAVPAIPSMIFLLSLFTIPRSPRWLAQRNRRDEACAALAKLGEPNPEIELDRILESLKIEMSISGERLFLRTHRLPIFLAMSIAAFCQLSGINAVLYYLNDIFAAASSSPLSAGIETVIIGVTNLIFTVVAILTIDRFGRRFLLLLGSVGMATTLAGIGFVFHTKIHENLLVWFLIAYCASFCVSLGAVMWVYVSEVFPNSVRAKGLSLGSTTHWVTNALVSAAFPVVSAYSKPLPFVFFAAMMVLQFFIVWFVYPETRNVSLETMNLGSVLN